MNTEVIVIGGGPSGLMAAVAAAESGASVLLVDKGDKLGRKLGISGGGRCNVTNNKDPEELIRHIPGNGRFLYSAMAQFNNRDIISFFERLGIRLKEENDGRMFPVSDKAQTVVNALVGRVKALGVRVLVNEPVERVVYVDGRTAGVRLRSGRMLPGKAVVVATGGKSAPQTGSTGDGYAWAEEAGHTIVPLYPTEVPLTSQSSVIRDRLLQGLALRDVALTVWNGKGKPVITHRGDMLFTHFGLSGPAALRCSQFVVKELQRSGASTVRLTIDLFPDESGPLLAESLAKLAAAEPRKTIKNVLKMRLPERLVPVLLNRAGIGESQLWNETGKAAREALVAEMKRFAVNINGTLPLEKAFVTGGGVNLKEVDPRTMQSKRMPGLFFCGEILDIHGYTGGYNITAAFITGHCAGRSAAAYAREAAEEPAK
jgi:hypothetical protein